jgi:hypothetical protein
MADTIRVIYKPVGGRYEIRRIPNTLAACQELVGGYIEPVTVCTDLVLVCNEEGRNLGLEPNPFLGHDFRGDWFLCGRGGEEFTDVPEDFLACVIDLAPAFVVIRPGAEEES